MGRLFGTDGLRGIANTGLSCELAVKTGRAVAEVLTRELSHRPRVLIGKDTRISGDMLTCALATGLCSMGADVELLGVIPTPAVAHLVKKYNADAGIVVSASHNPYEYNGIKIFNGEGFKLSDELEDEIEGIIVGAVPEPPFKTDGEIGVVRHVDFAARDYIEVLKGSIIGGLSGLRILVDCANGAASRTAGELFFGLGAKAELLSDKPDGVNINAGCGSTHIARLGRLVQENPGKYDLGVAFDGDADRCLLIDETGELIDGDKILSVCGKYLKQKGRLEKSTIVATVMSNMGFFEFAKQNDIEVLTTKVGDRYVLEEMQKGGFVLGGEQSGHVIFLDHGTTGDGQMTALKFMEVMRDTGKKASELASCMEIFPQTLLNIEVENSKKDELPADDEIRCAIKSAEGMLKGNGRVLVRASGTESLVRVMVEGREKSAVDGAARLVADTVKRRLA